MLRPLLLFLAAAALAAEPPEPAAGGASALGPNPLGKSVPEVSAQTTEQTWNWHVQNTDILQWSPGFPALYSGPNSFKNESDIAETVSLDIFAGMRLWRGAEAHLDALMWQGFGLSKTLGIEGFPSGEAFRLGTAVPNVTFARLFIRQTIALGGEEENVEDDQLHLAGTQDASRLTLTVGKMSAKDIFDNHAYANDSRTEFMNRALMANEAWDYPREHAQLPGGGGQRTARRPGC